MPRPYQKRRKEEVQRRETEKAQRAERQQMTTAEINADDEKRRLARFNEDVIPVPGVGYVRYVRVSDFTRDWPHIYARLYGLADTPRACAQYVKQHRQKRVAAPTEIPPPKSARWYWGSSGGEDFIL
jgi:hypothetical protein